MSEKLKFVYGSNPDPTKHNLTVNLVGVVRLMEKVGNTVYIVGNSPELEQLERLLGFNFNKMFGLLLYTPDGFYFANHSNTQGGYLGKDWPSAVRGLRARGLLVN